MEHTVLSIEFSVLRVGYVLNTYPQPSVTFIRREIAALERAGVHVHRFAMRSERETLKDAADLAEYERTEFVLRAGAGALIGALAAAAASPRRFGRALAIAWRAGAAGSAQGSGRLRHLIYLAEAAYIARRARALGLTHLHAHFGTNPAMVALLAHVLGGPGFSFTTHGPEEFDCPRALSLGEKIAHARFAVAISSYGRSQLSRWANFADWGRIKVIHCGIEPARFADPAPLPEGPRQLVAIGRFAEQKGLTALPAALALARAKAPDLRLVLVGDGPLRPEIEAAIRASGQQEAVTLTGWLDDAGVRRVLAQSHALVLPSFAEGLPVVVMEAMAAARPVIATYIAGIPELVTPDTGWLVPAGNAEALADAMLALARTPHEQLAAMGQSARTRAISRHDIDAEAARLARLFTENGAAP